MTQLTSWVHRYTLRDLLDDSFDLFKERVITLLIAGALPYILVVAYQALMRSFVFPGNFLRDYSDAEMKNLMGNTEFWFYLSGLIAGECHCVCHRPARAKSGRHRACPGRNGILA